ncbi:hypothetical protein [Amycolatopsis cihanbeyliensis]|uniref:Uncharacterized protein n=1 Tax=Amycolatopsis cihanbeyliensis TaxID=1128664 RepID=A0A542DMU8_AMYCI|nr:hypothetical protein [Amycolatopsis cihanbeyliensis]TQJ04422.1 hypothetical protein FB471_4215 [Amycolatopsis cihanbeyliensis]
MSARSAAIIGSIVLGLTFGSAGASGASVAGDERVLGPRGYKSLHLGQPEPAARATGLLVDKQAGEECHYYYLRPSEGQTNVGSGVFVDPGRGVMMIGGTVKSHTPKGVTLGSRFGEVRAAYPDMRRLPPLTWVYTAAVPGNEDARYRFAFDEAGRVADFALEAAEMGACG